ncbi:MAG: hypothetical protein OCC49_09000 [Fibrobacterales bacterium]
MARRVKLEEDMGAAISLEDALSIMVVVFVLFVVLFVPLIQLDRMNLDEALKNPFWEKIYKHIEKAELPADGQESLEKYYDSFDLEGNTNLISKSAKKTIYLESIDADSNVTVIIHDKDKKSYTVIYSQELSPSVSYRFGKIVWSRQEKSWFTLNDEVAYGDNPELIKQTKGYEKWVKAERGIINRKAKPNPKK